MVRIRSPPEDKKINEKYTGFRPIKLIGKLVLLEVILLNSISAIGVNENIKTLPHQNLYIQHEKLYKERFEKDSSFPQKISGGLFLITSPGRYMGYAISEFGRCFQK